MSAVSPESPRASASPSTSAGDQAGLEARAAEFGPNELLVEELYQRYLADPGSVDRAWWNFFADYQPSAPADAPAQAEGAAPAVSVQDAVTAPAAPPAPATPSAPRGTAGAAPHDPATAAAPATATPATATPATATPAAREPAAREPADGAEQVRLRGASARTATNMAASLSVP
ncbi:MAG TPA: hypothetical protein VGS62_08535, partial [Streptosporangiaceae bacterium]|nr:hypothetical protein [Streptosporangiaceae bacterium]